MAKINPNSFILTISLDLIYSTLASLLPLKLGMFVSFFGKPVIEMWFKTTFYWSS